MESVLLVERLKRAIQDDFKDMREELDNIKKEKEQLADKNDTLHKLNKELKDDNVSLTKMLKELKEKYDHLHGKLKRRQDEIKKKDQWWDRYRYTAETMIKKLRTQGSFSPEVLHEVSRDLVDIMEEASSKESSSTHSSQESEVKNPSKLTTSKDGKKKVRYTEVSPEHISGNHTGRVQSKEFTTRPNNEAKPNGDDESCSKKQDNLVPAAYPGDRVKTIGRKTEKENKNMMVSKKHCTEGITCLWSKKVGKNKENNEKNNLGSTNATKKGYEDDGNYLNDEETCGYPSLLTSTPMFSTSNKKPLSSDLALHDISIIHKDGEHLKSPNDMDGLLVAGAEPDDDDSSSPLTPAVPTIFENLLTRRTSLTSNSSVTTKTKNDEENVISKDENVRDFKKERKQSGNKELKIVISDIQKLKPTDKDNGTSPSILRNFEFGGNDTLDYPVASEDNRGSPSILHAVDIRPIREEDMKGLNLLSKMGLNGIKRKRDSFEEKEMGISEDDKKERPTWPAKKIPVKNTTENTFKMPIKPLHSINTNKQFKEAEISDPESYSIVLLTDDEDANKMETSSVDMFAISGKSLSKDLSNDVIDLIEDEGPSSKTAVPSTSQFTINFKNQDLIKQAEIENDLLNEEFPGFRKPDELNYKNITVVRKKDERLKLNGFSCRDCEQYYGEMTEEERKKKLKHCSRHRAKYSPPPSTPPGFWNLSFPSTQEVIEGGMMITGDNVPAQKPRRPRRKRLLKSIPKQV